MTPSKPIPSKEIPTTGPSRRREKMTLRETISAAEEPLPKRLQFTDDTRDDELVPIASEGTQTGSQLVEDVPANDCGNERQTEVQRPVTPDYADLLTAYGGRGDSPTNPSMNPSRQDWRKYAKINQFPAGVDLSMKWAEWIDYRRKLDISVQTLNGASQKDLAGFLFTNIGTELEDIIVTRGLYPRSEDKARDFWKLN